MQPVTSVTHRLPGLGAARAQLQPEPGAAKPVAPVGEPSTAPTQDQVELSPAVTSAAQSQPVPGMDRRIQDIRARIADGTYETPDKIDAVVDRLYQALFDG
jgi:hypothetical protein